jgi:GH24 family phage-related lysozyme (muramidase)
LHQVYNHCVLISFLAFKKNLDRDEKAALTDLVYNRGPGSLYRIRPLIRDDDLSAIPNQLQQQAATTVNSGLRNRRLEEERLFQQGLRKQQQRQQQQQQLQQQQQ